MCNLSAWACVHTVPHNTHSECACECVHAAAGQEEKSSTTELLSLTQVFIERGVLRITLTTTLGPTELLRYGTRAVIVPPLQLEPIPKLKLTIMY
jgi:hypothetical protein